MSVSNRCEKYLNGFKKPRIFLPLKEEKQKISIAPGIRKGKDYKMRHAIKLLLVMVLGFSGTSFATDFKVYPGAVLDKAETQKMLAVKAKASPALQKKMGTQTIYTTHHAFDKVFAFYRALYPESDINIKKVNAPMGEGHVLNDAYFCLDKAPSVARSKRWIKIQAPFVGTVLPGRNRHVTPEIRNVTCIILMEKK
jgi:hypothetical protein